jgi:hypothetical protein
MFWYVAVSVPVFACTITTSVAAYFALKTVSFKHQSRKALGNTFFDDIHSLNYIKRVAGTQDPQHLRKILSEALGEEVTQDESNAIWQITSKWEKKAYVVNESEFLERFYGPRQDEEEY